MKENNPLTFFVYCRKSSEDDRQAASIGDQLRELNTLTAREKLTLGDQPFTEEMSAKAPGRPVFNTMLARIDRGEANALLCWEIDRLYRNPVDEGRVRWLLQQGIIREIRTPFRTYYPQDAGLLLGVEGGKATDHIITLRKGVLRGFRGKLAKGWRPGPAPPGYLNNTAPEKGERTVVPDPDRFRLIRRAWDLMLTGQYSVRDICTFASEKWGLRSKKTKKLGRKPYSISGWYRIFTDPFYAGSFWWKTPETEIRGFYKGAHVPMITQEEYDRVQFILGRHGRPAPATHRFPFTGLIRCAECGAMITAEIKYQVICTACKTKFSALHTSTCSECDLAITKMEMPTRLHYTYYRCTKRKNPSCSERPLRAEALERQIEAILARIIISEEFLHWVLVELREQEVRDGNAVESVRHSLDRRVAAIRRELEHINAVILSADTDWTLISREEVRSRKMRLLKELDSVDQQVARQVAQGHSVLELSKPTFRFAAYAQFWLRQGDFEQKRAILEGLGSNLTLRAKTLELELRKPLRYVQELISHVPAISSGFEPGYRRFTKRKSPSFHSEIPRLRRAMNAVRTWWREHLDEPEIPHLEDPPSARRHQRE